MGSPEIDIDFDEMFREVMRQPGVKGAVQGRAAKIAAVARREFAKAKVDANVSISQVYIPSGRFGVNVTAHVADDDRVKAIGIMRRSGRSVRR